MTNVLYFSTSALVGYLLGAIPFGYLYVKLFRGVDVRQVGSGRTGGTNSFRAAGLGAGILTSLSDVLKGVTAVWIVSALFNSQIWLPWAQAVAGLFTVIGHNWSIYIKWAGGAGTGPNVGWSAALWWPMLPISMAVMVGLLRGLGIASVASMAMAVIIPVVFGVRYATGVDSTAAYLVAGIASLLVVLWALRPNIKRLLDGTERIVGPRAKRLTKEDE
ncbi:MAG: glycerol-3-phosphate acyltransferase [Anaerolineales bacterium]|nr:glycerol-3-phosphate acyltransferase [Anaerolineales bacterium]MCB8954345.1 glycerol-3-phosphate acyltransferase [Ardenticatenales bacterium]